MRKYIKISILVDNPKSWFHSYIGNLIREIKKVKKVKSKLCFAKKVSDLRQGDVLFILSCDRLIGKGELSLHRNNIVIHASDLPKGRGWSPMTWQVESGKNKIPICLFEASEECDSGDYYIKSYVSLDGTELIDKIREKLAKKVIMLIRQYLSSYPMKTVPQTGKSSHYRRRTSRDNELNVNSSIKRQFNKMRVADNERYPLHFTLKNKKYIVKIYDGTE
ncbi:MAG: methionyl-tRNA formyltransferase [Candidatus Omnitrophica bacterium]|nr:methionyl-tRNA formyltransferase [Candidatus Omnitrophota bacterium]